MATLDNTLGAFFIGVIVASILYGLTCLQTWYYLSKYPSDQWYLKFLVLASLASETVHQALITHVVYTYTITYFGVWEELTNMVWSLVVEVYFNGFTTLIVQCFLAWRIYKLSNRNLPLFISVLAFVISDFILILLYCARGVHMTTFLQLHSLKSVSKSVNIVTAVGDLYIAGLLCYLLQRSRTGFQRSDTMITKLVVFSINTGLLTSLCALASLISISLWPNAFIYFSFYFNIGRLYCNALLATLNARKGLRGEDDDEDMSLSMRGYNPRKTNASMIGTSSGRMPNNISIKIETVHERSQDEYSASGDLKDPEVV